MKALKEREAYAWSETTNSSHVEYARNGGRSVYSPSHS